MMRLDIYVVPAMAYSDLNFHNNVARARSSRVDQIRKKFDLQPVHVTSFSLVCRQTMGSLLGTSAGYN